MVRKKTPGVKGGKNKFWIAIDGIDGTGRTTIRNYICAQLSICEYNAFTFKVPHHEWAVRNYELSKRTKNEAEIDKHSFIANHHLEDVEIAKWLDKYDIIISQRFWLAQIPHRRIASYRKDPNVNLDEVDKQEAMDLGMSSLRKPDLIIYVALPDGAIGLERLKVFNRREDKSENLYDLKLQCEGYKCVYDKIAARVPPFDYLSDVPIFTVKGNRDLRQVVDECWGIVKKELSIQE